MDDRELEQLMHTLSAEETARFAEFLSDTPDPSTRQRIRDRVMARVQQERTANQKRRVFLRSVYAAAACFVVAVSVAGYVYLRPNVLPEPTPPVYTDTAGTTIQTTTAEKPPAVTTQTEGTAVSPSVTGTTQSDDGMVPPAVSSTSLTEQGTMPTTTTQTVPVSDTAQASTTSQTSHMSASSVPASESGTEVSTRRTHTVTSANGGDVTVTQIDHSGEWFSTDFTEETMMPEETTTTETESSLPEARPLTTFTLTTEEALDETTKEALCE